MKSKRRVPMIFREDDVPFGKPEAEGRSGIDSNVPPKLQEPRLSSRGETAEQSVTPVTLKTAEVSPSVPAVLPQKPKARPSVGAAPNEPSRGMQPLSFQQVKESFEKKQIGPRVHIAYISFLEELFHPVRDRAEGGMQTMLMACLEVVKRDPDLQRRAQAWAANELLDDD